VRIDVPWDVLPSCRPVLYVVPGRKDKKSGRVAGKGKVRFVDGVG
jgi:hypothetical protein